MEKAYKHLVTSLSMYGSRMASDNPIGASSFIEASGVLKSVQDKPKRTRPRKSTRQSKKIVNKTSECFENTLVSPGDGHDLFRFSETLKTETVKELKPLGVNARLNEGNEENTEEADDLAASAEEGDKNVDASENGNGDGTERHSKRRVSGHRRKLSAPPGNVTKGKEADNETCSVAKKKGGRPKLYGDGGVREFRCSQCNFVTTTKSKLNTHRVKVHESGPISCDLCPKVFPSKRYMLRHRASHTEPQHCCDVCGKMYKIKKAMLDHRKTHDVTYEKPKVSCDQCSKTFCNRYLLDNHIRDIHMGQRKSYLCSTCGKSFTTRHSLTEHTNAHIGVKPHVCEICGKSFSYESALRDHRFTHEESKQFWCKHCQKGFSQRSGLKMHMRTHRQHKMFVCSECGRGFTQKQALQRHERVHKGEKPFVCKHCGRLFTDASIIRRHLILVHKINKDAKSWREDIVCTVKPHNEYQVQRITEEEDAYEAERAKNELFVKAVGGAQPRTNSKGPSRAFCRTYPRKVAILDDQGNVIAPPEIPQRPLANKVEQTKEADRKDNDPVSISLQSSQIILAPEGTNADLRVGANILNQRYMGSSQWESIAEQLVSRNISSSNENENTASASDQINQIEHNTLEKPGQNSQEHLQNSFQKLITCKYDMPPGVVTLSSADVVGLNDASNQQSNASDRTAFVAPSNFFQQQQHHHQQHILKQQPHISEPISNSGPLSFTVSSTQAVTSQAVLDNLNQQAGTTSNVLAPSHIQYFEGRTTGTKSITNWPPMFYYSQFASQFGMSINSEYPYGSGIATSSSGIQICGQPSPPLNQNAGPAATTFILQGQPMPELEQIVGMKTSQGATVLHLESCDDQQQTEQQASELAISLQQDEPTADIQGRHLGSIPVADELILLHSQHHTQQQQQENTSTILISQRPSRHQQQLQHQEVDLVEQLAGVENISAEQHNILVRALDNASGQNSPSIQVHSREDSLAVLKEDIS
ncbi:GDNF-inducible zinc finger protein 1 [Elysia marginata]|uniref:GDNF-inducible zinc finger protein 1 n=1 Tax=Elysia marginata TaxID=1093978 RepID=A0AAV4H145_9GAST|nr:GDNF-inducible zinc finger protein 1 [Elysia marginata]